MRHIHTDRSVNDHLARSMLNAAKAPFHRRERLDPPRIHHAGAEYAADIVGRSTTGVDYAGAGSADCCGGGARHVTGGSRWDWFGI